MQVERAEIRLLTLPMHEPFAAAHGTSWRREITVIRIDSDEGSGWGECAALAEPTYTAEYAAGAFDVLGDRLVPMVIDREVTSSTIGRLLAPVRDNPMAKAALEMALLDIELRAIGRSLAAWLGATVDRVPAGVAVGLGTPEAVADRVEALASEGFGRVKLKIEPGHDRQVVEAVRSRCPHLELQLDGNGSYGTGADHTAPNSGRPGHGDMLAELAAEQGIAAIEQPFAISLVDHAARLIAELARRGLPTLVVCDEAAHSDRAVGELHDLGAVTAVSVKPSRLGGLGAALQVQRTALQRGLALTAGGMVETGLGRHALAAVAALPGFTLTGDVSPARRWLAADPWPDLTMIDGDILVPDGPGVAPEPDGDLIEAHTVRSVLRVASN